MKENMWMVRAGEGAEYFEEFKQKEYVSIGWNEIGPLDGVDNKGKIKQLLREKYEYKTGKIRISASQLYRFAFEIEIGDYILTYDPNGRTYLLGKIEGEYEYRKDVMDYFHVRKVKWTDKVNRDNLSTSTKNTLGAISTLFKIPRESVEEILAVSKGAKKGEGGEEEEQELDELKEDTKNRAKEFVKDKILELNWEEMEDLVAGILRAMGYKTRMTTKGPDRGRDIIASPDGLGFEKPVIIVEVKHRQNQKMGRKDISSLSGISKNKHGLFVSIGGFTQDAKYFADSEDIKLINLDNLVDIIFENYDNFDSETKSILPLTKIYWPQ